MMGRVKIAKDAADYGPGMAKAHCGICRHFQAPDGCERVVGRINPKAWCRLFSKKGTSS